MARDKSTKSKSKAKSKSKGKRPQVQKSKRHKELNKKAKTTPSISEMILLKLAELGELAGDILDAMAYPSLADGDREYWKSVKIEKETWRNNFYQLKRRGYIKAATNKDGICNYKLTEKGRLRIIKAKIKLLHFKRKKNKKWDKKWRILIFDIPEERRGFRDIFRVQLKLLGFKQLQKSVWICPFKMEPEFQKLIERYKLKKNIVTMVVGQNNIDGSEILKGIFFE